MTKSMSTPPPLPKKTPIAEAPPTPNTPTPNAPTTTAPTTTAPTASTPTTPAEAPAPPSSTSPPSEPTVRRFRSVLHALTERGVAALFGNAEPPALARRSKTAVCNATV